MSGLNECQSYMNVRVIYMSELYECQGNICSVTILPHRTGTDSVQDLHFNEPKVQLTYIGYTCMTIHNVL